MNALKNTFQNVSTRGKSIAALLTLLFVMAANNNDLQAQNNALALNTGPTAAETIKNDKLKAPRITNGDADAASDASKKNKFSIYVSGGNGGKMSVEEYANILGKSFADPRFTDKPMNLDVKHNVTSGPVKVSIYMNEDVYTHGKTYVFTPEQIGGAIQIIGDHFVDNYGDHLVLWEKVGPKNSLAGINSPENNNN